MRIVGGKYKGRPIAAPKSNDIRPTKDRTRESLFNILTHSYSDHLKDGRVLELFAGTGAVGVEALSRGAEFVLFVETSIEGRGLLRQNVDNLALQGCTRVFRRDATKLGPRGTVDKFDILFADPPYSQGLGEKAINTAADHEWLREGALVILEEHSDIEPKLDERFELQDARSFGETRMWFYIYNI
ncbi:16S rRNA (guanine(966)-N(2))-methyltransferase RsmD [Lentilitoribacter sp. Alg239-R112]|jgi:16S rRNA (guanine966-N2)-methyltransferase|uniref:16S rRNA (guanine(966)-N(2))-methyltransferase RsmD n=1 Tax=Lentilitoribacter sp. Alg239-R112 TaxID=2305987 RepID=UPI0013A6D5C9|nr:16S rRNA (guanine(966)-N(2))-methyltransferase RsmD [Lentilitoribacter sp. Alg239-R112]